MSVYKRGYLCSMLRQVFQLISVSAVTRLPVHNHNFLTMTKRSSSTFNKNHIVWMDLEMTGLDVDRHWILEASCIITDDNLNIIAQAPRLVINHSENVLANMDEWCVQQFAKTGLTEESRNSKLTTAEAEKTLVKFLMDYTPPKTCPLAGNTVYMDRVFLKKHMPTLDEYLHYRIIDVSTIKELCKRWNPQLYSEAPTKKRTHRSLDDILESIEELKFYKKYMFQ